MKPDLVLPPDEGLRERKKSARRAALVDAAQDLVRSRGLHGVTVEQICDRAGVSARTFFNYFDSKDDAVLGLARWRIDEQVAAEVAAGGPTGRLSEDLAHLARALVRLAAPHADRIACAMALSREEPELLVRQAAAMHRHHREVAAIWAARVGGDAHASRVELLTMLTLAATRNAWVRWEEQGRPGDVADAVPQVLSEIRDVLSD